ncbi:MAG: hypothetical protein LBQ84_05625 [Flavobacteriaceae bacterium]|jgi:hypothetical protein|nr:hypothetical protein [Flavobacteriaceae bacterium]
MKIKFILLLSVLGFITGNSQIVTRGSAQLFVNEGALVYSTGNIAVDNTTTATDKITNKGNIRISSAGTLIGSDSNDPLKEKFVLVFDSESKYGQLIIDKPTTGGTPTNYITVQRKLPDVGPYVYFGTPFQNYTYAQFLADIGATNIPPVKCGKGDDGGGCNYILWTQHPIFVWNNAKYRYDPHQFTTDGFTPGDYHTLLKSLFANNKFDQTISFKGTPYVAAGTAPIPYTNRKTAPVIEIGDGKLNAYGIYYYTYLTDPFTAGLNSSFTASTTEATLNAVDFSNRMLYLMNPYTSNIDLKALTNNFNGITGVGSDGEVLDDTPGNGFGHTRYNGKIQLATVSNGDLLGDGIKLRYIPPMTNFFIKASADDLSLDLFQTTTDFQTFKSGGYSSGGGSQFRSSNYIADKYQLNLILSSGDVRYGNTYVAAGEDLITGATNDSEARNESVVGNITGIYTIPEAETGGVALGYENTKLYINVINTDAAKVAIPVGVSISNEDKGKEFTFTSDLRINQVFLQAKGSTNFDNPDAKFYFHDKKTNAIIEIDTDFSYSVTLNESVSDRFEIFFKETGLMGNDDVLALKGLTTVYKTGDEYKVRFDKDWEKADVNVFSIVGQLISSEKNIDTQNDYLLPIYNSSVYVVIVINSITGEKVVKKIVK